MKYNPMKYKIIILLSALLSIIACSETGTKPATTITPEQLAADKGYQLGDSVDRIMNYKLNGWNYVSSKALIMHTSGRQKYLITLRNRCHELSSREIIGTSSTNTAMRAKHDAIIVQLDGGVAAHNTRKCYIDQIFKLEKTRSDQH